MMILSYKIQKNIGKGSYGEVYKVINKTTLSVYAMKKVSLSTLSHYEKLNLITELRILATHKCPFIVKFKTAFVENRHMYFITEFAENGDLAIVLKNVKSKNQFLNEDLIWTYFLQTCIALSYLHNLKIIHRDLKPANIFIDKHNNVKLGDFGIAKIMHSFMMYGQTQIGTPLYMCPEIYKRERYDAKVDIWALGCVLHEMMTLKPTFYAKNIHELKKNIFQGNIPDVVHTYSLELKNMLKQLVCIYPRHRPSIQTILNTKFVHEQLNIRKLQFLDTFDIEPAFHVTCLVPKIIDKWRNVVDMFVSLNATVMLNSQEQKLINNVNDAKNKLSMAKKASEVVEINTKIQSLEVGISEAKQYIENCESILKGLYEQKKSIEYRMNNLKLKMPAPPTGPPPSNPPPHRSPRIFRTPS